MTIEEELNKLAKEAEVLFKSILLTRQDNKKIKEIRDDFKRESEEAMKTVYQETKRKYIQAELEYLRSAHNL